MTPEIAAEGRRLLEANRDRDTGLTMGSDAELAAWLWAHRSNLVQCAENDRKLAWRELNEATLEAALSESMALAERLSSLSRIVRRALACHQLEKLEDARRYLDDEPTPQRAGETEREG